MQHVLTYNLKISHLADHGVGIHLAHIIATVLLVDATHMQ